MKLVALLAALLCLASVCAAQTTAAGSVSGVVRDVATGEPVAQAAVSLRMQSGRVLTTQADAQGQYAFNGLAAGTYRINAASPLEKGQTQTPQQEQAVRLEVGQKLTGVDFRLPSMGVISGRVLDENQEPVAGVPVVLVAKRYDHGALRFPLAAGRTQTDDAGVYRLSGIPAGAAYLVETRYPLPQKSTEGDSPADTFFPNVLLPEQAEELVLNQGEMRNGVDIQQKKLPTYCVDGAVEGEPGPPLDLEIQDALVTESGRQAQRNIAAKTKPDGTFHVCGLHPGQYVFNASNNSPSAGKIGLAAAATVDVKNENVSDVRLLRGSATTVAIDLVWEGDPPAQSATQPPVPLGTITAQGRRVGTLQLSFAFGASGAIARTVMFPPDDYTISIQAVNSGERYVKDITCGGASVLRGTVALGWSASCATLRVLMAQDGGSLTARVADTDGNPIANANVAIIPESATTEAEMAATMIFGQTGANGVYTAKPLPPGRYRVLATNGAIDMVSNHVDQLWTAQLRAQEVEIAANANVQLKLDPPPSR